MTPSQMPESPMTPEQFGQLTEEQRVQWLAERGIVVPGGGQPLPTAEQRFPQVAPYQPQTPPQTAPLQGNAWLPEARALGEAVVPPARRYAIVPEAWGARHPTAGGFLENFLLSAAGAAGAPSPYPAQRYAGQKLPSTLLASLPALLRGIGTSVQARAATEEAARQRPYEVIKTGLALRMQMMEVERKRQLEESQLQYQREMGAAATARAKRPVAVPLTSDIVGAEGNVLRPGVPAPVRTSAPQNVTIQLPDGTTRQGVGAWTGTGWVDTATNKPFPGEVMQTGSAGAGGAPISITVTALDGTTYPTEAVFNTADRKWFDTNTGQVITGTVQRRPPGIESLREQHKQLQGKLRATSLGPERRALETELYDLERSIILGAPQIVVSEAPSGERSFARIPREGGLATPVEGATPTAPAALRNMQDDREAVGRGIPFLKALSGNLIARTGPMQRLQTLWRSGAAFLGNDPDYRNYTDAVMPLSLAVASLLNKGRPTEPDRIAASRLFPMPFRDTTETAPLKWALLELLLKLPESELAKIPSGAGALPPEKLLPILQSLREGRGTQAPASISDVEELERGPDGKLRRKGGP